MPFYKLINIHLSDEFAGEFGSVGNTATCAELDSGDKMQFPEDKNLADNLKSPINPRENIQPHGWKKLRGMCRDVHRLCKEVLHNFRESGTHESDFIKFSDGKMAAYYLR